MAYIVGAGSEPVSGLYGRAGLENDMNYHTALINAAQLSAQRQAEAKRMQLLAQQMGFQADQAAQQRQYEGSQAAAQRNFMGSQNAANRQSQQSMFGQEMGLKRRAQDTADLHQKNADALSAQIAATDDADKKGRLEILRKQEQDAADLGQKTLAFNQSLHKGDIAKQGMVADALNDEPTPPASSPGYQMGTNGGFAGLGNDSAPGPGEKYQPTPIVPKPTAAGTNPDTGTDEDPDDVAALSGQDMSIGPRKTSMPSWNAVAAGAQGDQGQYGDTGPQGTAAQPAPVGTTSGTDFASELAKIPAQRSNLPASTVGMIPGAQTQNYGMAGLSPADQQKFAKLRAFNSAMNGVNPDVQQQQVAMQAQSLQEDIANKKQQREQQQQEFARRGKLEDLQAQEMENRAKGILNPIEERSLLEKERENAEGDFQTKLRAMPFGDENTIRNQALMEHNKRLSGLGVHGTLTAADLARPVDFNQLEAQRAAIGQKLQGAGFNSEDDFLSKLRDQFMQNRYPGGVLTSPINALTRFGEGAFKSNPEFYRTNLEGVPEFAANRYGVTPAMLQQIFKHTGVTQ